jgi:hypothetical protein
MRSVIHHQTPGGFTTALEVRAEGKLEASSKVARTHLQQAGAPLLGPPLPFLLVEQSQLCSRHSNCLDLLFFICLARRLLHGAVKPRRRHCTQVKTAVQRCQPAPGYYGTIALCFLTWESLGTASFQLWVSEGSLPANSHEQWR